MEETPLTGGRVTAGVVRVGDTVRRPMQGDRSLVHGLLSHLEACGFEGAPRFLGVDGTGREILSYLPGDVPSDLGHYEDVQLDAAAALLRRFHDATASFARNADPAAEVICHNDWGPPNAVFRQDIPYGLIDFDTIAPGLRLWDIGYSALSWLDLGDPAYSADEQLRRLAVFTRGYGLESCSEAQIAVHALARQTALAASGRRRGMTALVDWAEASAAWTALNVVERLLPTRM
jgi:aminoglycoside phosphotransferase (APT) family kinase protein